MVVFQPTPSRSAPSSATGDGGPATASAPGGVRFDGFAPVRATRADDFRPLALAATGTIDLREIGRAARTAERRIRAERETYVARETRPAPASPLPADEGTIWRAGILDELRNPRPKGPVAQRIVCSADDHDEWLRMRREGITATDAARLATAGSVNGVVNDKLGGSGFAGNRYTEFGRMREPIIADWVRERHGIGGCGLLIRAEADRRHLATPDGLAEWGAEVVLAEIKTTNKPWSRIPRNYLRQVWWQQYVVGAERTLFVWERHDDFVVQDDEPTAVWIERDDAEIAKLVRLADAVLERLDELRAG
ncbi:MAG: YqaJ viral recombinase family protein [Microbacteriaceae bacterium]|nr:YqaJ viral recombinase family protein [Microbacteriaceae bacterium]